MWEGGGLVTGEAGVCRICGVGFLKVMLPLWAPD